jgi:hypothetical protein
MNKQQLKSLLGKGEVEQVLSHLELYSRSKGDDDLLNQIILQRNRVKGYSMHQQNDTLSPEEIQRLRNQVVEALLSIIDGMEEDSITENKSGFSLMRLLLIGILPAIVILIGYQVYRSYSVALTNNHVDVKNSHPKPPDATTLTRQVSFPNGSTLSFRSASGEKATYYFTGGRIEPSDEASIFLTVNVRCENQDNYPINFWDRSFRLKIFDPEQYLAPKSEMNEVVTSHSDKTGEIVFEVPNSVTQAILEVQDPFGLAKMKEINVSLQ